MKKLLSIAFIGLFLAACGDSSSQDTNSSSLEQNTTSITLNVGTSPNYKPFEYKENDALTGFEVELVNEIAKREGIKVNWVEMSFDGLIPALSTGKIDMIASAMSITEERKESVDFTNPFYMSKNLYIKKKDNTSLNTKEDLVGKTIGVQLGTIQENAAKAIKDAIVQTNEDLNVLVLALKGGKIDAVIADKDVSLDFLKQNDDLASFFEEDDGNGGISFAFAKGKENDALQKFNEGLNQMKSDGSYDTLLKKYELK